MNDVQVHRYEQSCGFQGWIEPADRSWIVFVTDDGRPVLFDQRDLVTGAVL